MSGYSQNNFNHALSDTSFCSNKNGENTEQKEDDSANNTHISSEFFSGLLFRKECVSQHSLNPEKTTQNTKTFISALDLSSLTNSPGRKIPGKNAQVYLDSERESILRGLHSMKQKISDLEHEKQQTERNLQELRKGLENYTDLVAKNAQTSSKANRAVSDINVENEGLLNDTSIMNIYENLRHRLENLEAERQNFTKPRKIMEQSTKNINNGSNSSSDVEKSRAAAPDRFNLLKNHSSILDRPDLPAFSAKNNPKNQPKIADVASDLNLDELNRTSSSLASTGSSRSLKLTKQQRENLSKLSQKLKSGELRPPAASSPLSGSPQKTLQPSNRSAQCDLEDKKSFADKSAQYNEKIGENSTSLKMSKTCPAEFNFTSPKVKLFEGIKDARLDYDRLHRELKELKNQAAKATKLALNSSPEKVQPQIIETLQSPSSSISASPVRKIKKLEGNYNRPKPTLFNRHNILPEPMKLNEAALKPAFVAGMSVQNSHSVWANFQELLSVLKSQNPVLHHAALKLYQNGQIFKELGSSMNLAGLFLVELRKMKKHSVKDLKSMLNEYDEITKMDNKSAEMKQKENKLVAEMERKDTYIQRLSNQIEWLKSIIDDQHKNQALDGKKACMMEYSLQQNHHHGHLTTRHTVASRQKLQSQKLLASRQKVHLHELQARRAKYAKILKEIRQVKDAVHKINENAELF